MKEADSRIEKGAGVSASTSIMLMALEMNRGTTTGSPGSVGRDGATTSTYSSETKSRNEAWTRCQEPVAPLTGAILQFAVPSSSIPDAKNSCVS